MIDNNPPSAGRMALNDPVSAHKRHVRPLGSLSSLSSSHTVARMLGIITSLTRTRETGMDISGLLDMNSQPYQNPGFTTPEARTHDLLVRNTTPSLSSHGIVVLWF
uniref:Uncharacterized protein n=1 Tax=Schistocephalus solidus TaxID=70667 RepID=A0A0V0J9J7_SCHSO